MTDRVHVSMSADDFRFITTYDPERERSASRRDMVAVVEEIQTILLDGLSESPQYNARCLAVLANRMLCVAPLGHGGRHDWREWIEL